MIVVSYSESRARYAEMLDRAATDLEEVVVIRAGKDPAVIVSLSEWEALKETAHLLSSPANAARLAESIVRVAAGDVQEHELFDS